MGLQAVIAAVCAWMAARGFTQVTVERRCKQPHCVTAVSPEGRTVIVLRPRLMDKREYTRLLTRVERAQRNYDVVYVTMTRGNSFVFRQHLARLGIGLLTITGYGTVIEEIVPV